LVRFKTLVAIDGLLDRGANRLADAATGNKMGGRRAEDTTRRGSKPVPIQLFLVRERSGYWEVRLDGRLKSGQPTQMAAVHYAGTLAQAAAARGVRSKILLFDANGGSLEFPVVGPEPVADVA